MKAMQDFFDNIIDSYAVQDYDAVAAHYDIPGALYLEEDVIVWSTRRHLRYLLALHCRSNYALGVRGVKVTVRASEPTSKAHFSAWVTWHHLDQQGEELFTMRCRYFCRNRSGKTPVIQLVEVPRRPRSYNENLVARPLRKPSQPVALQLATLH